MAAIFDEEVIVCWNYPSGEILFQKKLDEPMHRIQWNPFRPNVFATFRIVSYFFISNLFPRVRYTSCHWSCNSTAKSNMLICLEPQSGSVHVIKHHAISALFYSSVIKVGGLGLKEKLYPLLLLRHKMLNPITPLFPNLPYPPPLGHSPSPSPIPIVFNKKTVLP